MANKIELREALESHEPDDVKVKKILEALYYLLKKEHYHPPPTIPEVRPPPLPPHPKRNPFDFFSYTGMLIAVARKP